MVSHNPRIATGTFVGVEAGLPGVEIGHGVTDHHGGGWELVLFGHPSETSSAQEASERVPQGDVTLHLSTAPADRRRGQGLSARPALVLGLGDAQAEGAPELRSSSPRG